MTTPCELYFARYDILHVDPIIFKNISNSGDVTEVDSYVDQRKVDVESESHWPKKSRRG